MMTLAKFLIIIAHSVVANNYSFLGFSRGPLYILQKVLKSLCHGFVCEVVDVVLVDNCGHSVSCFD